MILNVENSFGGMMPCRCFDANGLEWTLVRECDTETGRIERFVPHPETGNPYINDEGTEAVRETVHAAAPLIVVRVER